ncbi:high-affinity choline transporter 1-like [Argopecten irradians]|uniref:high-affinity choline transporter 1-like n=1 Tax=Argopecten irradians TaxID=31199 RepID=UPI00371103DE
MAVNVLGLVAIAVFYVIILIIGIVAGRKSTKSNNAEELFVANRSFGLFVASFTTAAILPWSEGGYINGTAEAIWGERRYGLGYRAHRLQYWNGNWYHTFFGLDSGIFGHSFVLLGLNMTMSVIVSACVAVVYTFFGGLYAVAYTDVIQLFFMGIGLCADMQLVDVTDFQNVTV